VLSVNPVFAAGGDDDFSAFTASERKAALKELEFSDDISQDQIDSLSDAMIYELSKEDGEIVSIKKVSRNLDTGNEDEIGTRTLDPDDFEMTVVAKRIYEKSGKDNFKFVATGEWLTNPVYEFTDAIALAWSDDFTLYDDDCYVMTSFGAKRDVVTLNDVDPEGGIAYDIDLLVGRDEDEIVLTAKVYKDDDDGSANVVGEYGHVQIQASSINVGFSSGSRPSVEMSVSYAADIEMASPDYDSFDY